MSIFRLRNRYFVLFDVLLLTLTPAVALALRLDLVIPSSFELILLIFTVLALLVKIPTLYFFGLYHRLWRYASMDELITIAWAVLIAGVIVTALFYALRSTGLLGLDAASFPRSLPVLDAGLTLLAVGGLRFSVRAAEHYQLRRNHRPAARRVLIVGAGSSGSLLARELRTNPSCGLEPVGFIDDDPAKGRLRIHDVPVLGPHSRLVELARATKAEEVLIAMPSASGKTIRQMVEACRLAGLPSRTLPGLAEIVSGRVSVNLLRPVNIEDLLRREPVDTDLAAVRGMLAGRRVLVTGAGGSIGSELCRQIARCSPAQIIALGHGENSLFQLAEDLGRAFKDLPAQSIPELQLAVADIRDRPRLTAIFQRFQPQVVFHAAAHKHVPLMEANLEDAVSNNVLGTRQVVELAEANGVERFVLISSDKAVNPTSVMGATKRVAELLVGEAAQRCGRPFVAVRFGNVLGSRGSVLPTFHRQIAAGGPLTITHPDMQRYFMIIPEAVQLVLQAAVLGEPGRVFVLDMGQPVKLVDLAQDLVRLSGLELGRDIDLVFTGIRPGEKLFEELFGGQENFIRTAHAKIFAAQNGHRAPTALTLTEMVDGLLAAGQAGCVEDARHWLQQIIPEYQPDPGLPDDAAAPIMA
jgi:FlaA1/EpsC-like NDP-sugar epimerase